MEGIGADSSHGDRRSWVEGSSLDQDLPEELWCNVLSRLSVKTVIRFTSVCKSWLRFIKSPQFAGYHYATRTNLLGDAFEYLLAAKRLSWVNTTFSFISYDTLQLNVNDPVSPPIFECKPFPPLRSQDHGNISCGIVGPCNGIFCLKIYFGHVWISPILLWNPAIRETRALTHIPEDFEQLGFGFDSVSGDYKVVCAYGKSLENNNVRLAEVYSLNSDSWRTLDVSYFFDGSRKFSAFYSRCSSNGRMFNWIGYDVSSLSRQYLITFDMSDEVFMQTPLPGNYSYYDFTMQQSNKNRVCIFGYESETYFELKAVDFWVLDSDYGPDASWTILRSVAFPIESIQNCVLLGLWKDEKLLFERDRMLVSYDPILKLMRYSGVEGNFSSIGVGYTQSLVSVKRIGGQENRRIQQLGLVRTCDRVEFLSLGVMNEQEQENLFKFELEFPPDLLSSPDADIDSWDEDGVNEDDGGSGDPDEVI